jgi:hypothetical protein
VAETVEDVTLEEKFFLRIDGLLKELEDTGRTGKCRN